MSSGAPDTNHVTAGARRRSNRPVPPSKPSSLLKTRTEAVVSTASGPTQGSISHASKDAPLLSERDTIFSENYKDESHTPTVVDRTSNGLWRHSPDMAASPLNIQQDHFFEPAFAGSEKATAQGASFSLLPPSASMISPAERDDQSQSKSPIPSPGSSNATKAFTPLASPSGSPQERTKALSAAEETIIPHVSNNEDERLRYRSWRKGLPGLCLLSLQRDS